MKPSMKRRPLLSAALTLSTMLLGVGALPLPASLDKKAAIAGPTTPSDRWAVLVGVNNYQGKTVDTVGSLGDVADLRDVLLRSGWRDDHILVLTENNATATRIRESWKWLIARATDTSFSVFHYSGHVKQMAGDKDRDGEDTDEFLWSVDNQFLSDGEFAASMRQLHGWGWVSVSGCEAAGFNEGIAAPNRLFTASSLETQKSYEEPNWGNSVHMGFFADQGLLQRFGDTNGDKRVSLQEGFNYSANNTPSKTDNQRKGIQTPVMSGGDGTEWFLENLPLPAPPPSSGGGDGGGGGGTHCLICIPPRP